MAHGWPDDVCCITQSIVRLKSNSDIGHPCLTLVFTPCSDVQLPLPFSALLDDVAQSKDLFCASLSFLKTCLLLSESLVYCFRDPADGGLGMDLAVDRQKGGSSPVVTLSQGSFLWNLHDTLCPFFRNSCFSSDSYYHEEWLKNLCCVEAVLS